MMGIGTLLSYLDRQTLALLSPMILRETHMNAQAYGEVISAFSFAYMVSTVIWGAAHIAVTYDSPSSQAPDRFEHLRDMSGPVLVAETPESRSGRPREESDGFLPLGLASAHSVNAANEPSRGEAALDSGTALPDALETSQRTIEALRAFPEIALVLGEKFEPRGNQDLVGTLPVAAAGRGHDPTQSRSRARSWQSLGAAQS